MSPDGISHIIFGGVIPCRNSQTHVAKYRKRPFIHSFHRVFHRKTAYLNAKTATFPQLPFAFFVDNIGNGKRISVRFPPRFKARSDPFLQLDYMRVVPLVRRLFHGFMADGDRDHELEPLREAELAAVRLVDLSLERGAGHAEYDAVEP